MAESPDGRGLIVQWGRETNSPGLTSIVFPLAFPTECFVVMLTQRNSIGGSTNNIGATNYSKTGFDLYASTNEVPNSWFAVGY